MWLVISMAAAILVGVWLATPTMWTLVRPGFQPVRRSDASVFQAQQSSHP
jgi:hypothetical protein